MVFDANVSSHESDARQPQAEAEAASAVEEASADASETVAAPVWLQRLSLLVLVIFCVYLGVLVTVLPWWPRLWDRNLFIRSHPSLAAILYNGAVRGVISGIGLLDIWIGLSEAIHYREQKR